MRPAIIAAIVCSAMLVAQSAQKRVYNAADREVTPAIPVKMVKAEYDSKAKAEKIEGVVKLWTVLSEKGIPEQITVVQRLDPRLDTKAIEAAKQWRFEPAKLKSMPVPYKVMLELNFRLNE